MANVWRVNNLNPIPTASSFKKANALNVLSVTSWINMVGVSLLILYVKHIIPQMENAKVVLMGLN